jgi:hypothetical protein
MASFLLGFDLRQAAVIHSALCLSIDIIGPQLELEDPHDVAIGAVLETYEDLLNAHDVLYTALHASLTRDAEASVPGWCTNPPADRLG